MPTKVTGTKDADQVAAKLLRKHPLMTATPAEINAQIEAVENMADVKRILKILARGQALLLQKKL